ncbi:DUF418 domain-containing protein, partial [Mycolicibacterium sp. CBMA 361]
SLAGVTALLNLPLAAAYAATILRLAQHRPRLAQTLGTAGKFAATIYISQSVITSVIFTGSGFALVGKLPDWLVLVIAAAIYGAQLVGSRIWARHHRYGPIEWVLRRATYGPRSTWPAR